MTEPANPRMGAPTGAVPVGDVGGSLPSDPGPVASFPTRMNQRALRKAVAERVRQIPGVHGLEPTLSTAGLRAMYRPTHTDGVQIVVRGGVVDVDINLAATSTGQVRRTAQTVQTTISELVRAAGYTAGSTTVSVLRLEPPTPQL